MKQFYSETCAQRTELTDSLEKNLDGSMLVVLPDIPGIHWRVRGKWNLVCIHYRTLLSFKKYKIQIHSVTWMNFENMLSKISKTQKE